MINRRYNKKITRFTRKKDKNKNRNKTIKIVTGGASLVDDNKIINMFCSNTFFEVDASEFYSHLNISGISHFFEIKKKDKNAINIKLDYLKFLFYLGLDGERVRKLLESYKNSRNNNSDGSKKNDISLWKQLHNLVKFSHKHNQIFKNVTLNIFDKKKNFEEFKTLLLKTSNPDITDHIVQLNEYWIQQYLEPMIIYPIYKEICDNYELPHMKTFSNFCIFMHLDNGKIIDGGVDDILTKITTIFEDKIQYKTKYLNANEQIHKEPVSSQDSWRHKIINKLIMHKRDYVRQNINDITKKIELKIDDFYKFLNKYNEEVKSTGCSPQPLKLFIWFFIPQLLYLDPRFTQIFDTAGNKSDHKITCRDLPKNDMCRSTNTTSNEEKKIKKIIKPGVEFALLLEFVKGVNLDPSKMDNNIKIPISIDGETPLDVEVDSNIPFYFF